MTHTAVLQWPRRNLSAVTVLLGSPCRSDLVAFDSAFTDAGAPTVWHELTVRGPGTHCTLRLENVTVRRFSFLQSEDSMKHSRVEMVNVNVDPTAEVANVSDTTLGGTFALPPVAGIRTAIFGWILENTTIEWYGSGGANSWNRWANPDDLRNDERPPPTALELDRYAADMQLVRMKQARIGFRRVEGPGTTVVLQSMVLSLSAVNDTGSSELLRFERVTNGAAVLLGNVVALQNTTGECAGALLVERVEAGLVLLDNCWIASKAVDGGRWLAHVDAYRSAVPSNAVLPRTAADLSFLPFSAALSESTKELLLAVVPGKILQEDAATLIVFRQCLLQLDARNDGDVELLSALSFNSAAGTSPLPAGHQHSGPAFVVAGTNTTVSSDAPRALRFVGRDLNTVLVIAGNASATTVAGASSPVGPSLFFVDLRKTGAAPLSVSRLSEWAATQTAAFGPSQHAAVGDVISTNAQPLLLFVLDAVKHIWIVGNDGDSTVESGGRQTLIPNVRDWTTDAFIGAADGDGAVNPAWPVRTAPSWSESSPPLPPDAPAKGRPRCGLTFEAAASGLSLFGFLPLTATTARVDAVILDSVEVTLGVGAVKHASSIYVAFLQTHTIVNTAFSIRRLRFESGSPLTNVGGEVSAASATVFHAAFDDGRPAARQLWGFPDPQETSSGAAALLPTVNGSSMRGLMVSGAGQITGGSPGSRVLFTSLYLVFRSSGTWAIHFILSVTSLHSMAIANSVLATDGLWDVVMITHLSKIQQTGTVRFANNDVVVTSHVDAMGYTAGLTQEGVDVAQIIIEADYVAVAAPQARGVLLFGPFRTEPSGSTTALPLSITVTKSFITARMLWLPAGDAARRTARLVQAVGVSGVLGLTTLALHFTGCRLEASDSFMVAPRVFGVLAQVTARKQGKLDVLLNDTVVVVNSSKHLGEDASLISIAPSLTARRNDAFNMSVAAPLPDQLLTPVRHAAVLFVDVAAHLQLTHRVVVQHSHFVAVANWIPCGVCFAKWTGSVLVRNMTLLIADGVNAHLLDDSPSPTISRGVFFPTAVLTNATRIREALSDDHLRMIAARGVAAAVQFMGLAAMGEVVIEQTKSRVVSSTPHIFHELYSRDEEVAKSSAAETPSPLPHERPFEHPPTAMWRAAPQQLPDRPEWDVSNVQGTAAFFHVFTDYPTATVKGKFVVVGLDVLVSAGVAGHCYGLALRMPLAGLTGVVSISRANISLRHDAVGASRWRDPVTSVRPSAADNAWPAAFSLSRAVRAVTAAVFINASKKDSETTNTVLIQLFENSFDVGNAVTDDTGGPLTTDGSAYLSRSPLGEFGSFKPSGVPTPGDVVSGESGGASMTFNAGVVPVIRDLFGIAVLNAAVPLVLEDNGVTLHSESAVFVTPSMDGGAPTAQQNSIALSLPHTVAAYFLVGSVQLYTYFFQGNNGTVRVAAPRLNQLLRRTLCQTIAPTGPHAPWSYDALIASMLGRQAAGFVVDHRLFVNGLYFARLNLVVDGVDVPRAAGLVFSARPIVHETDRIETAPYLLNIVSSSIHVRARTGVATGLSIENGVAMQSLSYSRFDTTVTGAAAAVGVLVRATGSNSLIAQVHTFNASVSSLAGPAVFFSSGDPIAAPAIAHQAAALGRRDVLGVGSVVRDGSIEVSGNAALCGDPSAVKAACLLGQCLDDPGVAERMDFDALVQHCVSATSMTVAAANGISNAAVPSGLTAHGLPEGPPASSVVTVSLREFIQEDPTASLPADSDGSTRCVLSWTTAASVGRDGSVNLIQRCNVTVRTTSDLLALPDDYVAVAESEAVAAGRLILSTNPGAASFELVPAGRQPRTSFARPAPLAAASVVHGSVPSIHVLDSSVVIHVASSITAALLSSPSSAEGPVAMPKRLAGRCTPMMSGRARKGEGSAVSFLAPTCVGDPSHSLGTRFCHPVAVLFAVTAAEQSELRRTPIAIDVAAPLSCPLVATWVVVGSIRSLTGAVPTLEVTDITAHVVGGAASWVLALHGTTVATRTVSILRCNVTTEATPHTADLALAPGAWASNWTGSVEVPPFSTIQLYLVRSTSRATLGRPQTSLHLRFLAELLKTFPSVWIDSAPLPSAEAGGAAVLTLVRTEGAVLITPGPRSAAAIDAPVTNISYFNSFHDSVFANVMDAVSLVEDTSSIVATLLKSPPASDTTPSGTLSDFNTLPQQQIGFSRFIEKPLMGFVFTQALWGSPSSALPATLTARNGGWLTIHESILRSTVVGAPTDARKLVPVIPASTGDLPRLSAVPTYTQNTPWLGGLQVSCSMFNDEFYPFAPDVSLGLGVSPPETASVLSPCKNACDKPAFALFARGDGRPDGGADDDGRDHRDGGDGGGGERRGVGVAANVGRVTFLAALVECDGGLETGEQLPVQSHPARVALGSEDDPLRYHVGAVVCNVAIPAVAALLWMAAVFLWCYARGKFTALSKNDTNGNRRNQHQHTPQVGLSGGQQFALVMSYARLPSLLSVPYMLLVQPTFSSALLVVMKATDPFVRFAGAAVLVGIAASFVWALWVLTYATFPAVFVPTVCDPSLKSKSKSASTTTRAGLDDLEEDAPATDSVMARLRAAVVWFLEPVGEWIDLFPNGSVAQRTFVQRHFLLIADYTGRWRWFIVVEVGLNAVLAVIEATATEESCTAAAWVTTVLSFAYVAVVLWCRPHESVFNFYFTLFLGAANAVAALLASVHQHVQDDGLVVTVEVFLRVALYASSMRLAYDIARVAMQLLRRRARDTHKLLRRAARMMAGHIDGRLVSPADAEALAANYGQQLAGEDSSDSFSDADEKDDDRRGPACVETHESSQSFETGVFDDAPSTQLGTPRAHRTPRKYVPSWTFQPERYRRNMERLTGVFAGLDEGGGGALGDTLLDDAGDGEQVDSMVRDMAGEQRRLQRERKARVAKLAAESEARALRFAAFTAEQTKI